MSKGFEGKWKRQDSIPQALGHHPRCVKAVIITKGGCSIYKRVTYLTLG